MISNKKGADTRAINIIIAGVLIFLFIFVFYKWFNTRSTESSISIQHTTIVRQELQQTFATFLTTHAEQLSDADAEQISKWIRQAYGLSPEPPEDPTYSSIPQPDCTKNVGIDCDLHLGGDYETYARQQYEETVYLATKEGIIPFHITVAAYR